MNIRFPSAPHNRRLFRSVPRGILILTGSVLTVMVTALAGSPQISHVHPDFSGRHLRHVERGKDFFHHHHVVTGESLAAEGIEFWVWNPSGDPKEAILSDDFEGIQLPATPPEGARRVQPIDFEDQVAVVNLGHHAVVWVGQNGEFSDPYLMNVAKPFWLQSDAAWPGKHLAVYGFGLRGFVSWAPPAQVALRSSTGTRMVGVSSQARSPRHLDPQLIHFRIPADCAIGDYEVWVHNGFGGEFGWRSAGRLTVRPSPAESPVFNVHAYGAVGDGETDDLEAIRAAVAAASAAGGGRVFLPPGTYIIEETLQLSENIALTGAGRDQSVLKGRYQPSALAFSASWAPTSVAASVLVMESRTRIEQIAVRGAVAAGYAGYGMVTAASTTGALVEHVVIRDCLINAPEEDLESGHYLYRAAIVIPGSRRVAILGNDIHGSLEMRPGTWRSDIINNTFRGGTALDVASVVVSGADNLIDSNRLVDTPGRLVLYGLTRTYVRYNELHNIGRGGWTHVSESFLLHGGADKTMGGPSEVTADSLTDTTQKWEDDQYVGATVLITHGKGFGQYRIVTGNTEDTLHVEQPWRVLPDASSEYAVGGYFTENALYNNQNHSPGVTALWLGCISNLVEKHRDNNGSGITILGQDRSSVNAAGQGSQLAHFHPSWYNMITDNWLDGSPITVVPGVSKTNAWKGIPLFANTITHNKIKHPHAGRSPNRAHNVVVGGLQLDGGEGRVGASHNILAGNQISNTPVGAVIQGNARKTFLLGNVFHDVDHPVVDTGFETILRNNDHETLGADGVTRVPVPDRQ